MTEDVSTSPPPLVALQSVTSGFLKVVLPDCAYVLAPANPGSSGSRLPHELVGLTVITSDNPGGLTRPHSVNAERRVDLRAELATLRIQGRLTRLYPAQGASDLTWSSVEVGMACDLPLDDALAVAHSYGQLAVYQLVEDGRILVPCVELRRSSAYVQPVSVIRERLTP